MRAVCCTALRATRARDTPHGIRHVCHGGENGRRGVRREGAMLITLLPDHPYSPTSHMTLL